VKPETLDPLSTDDLYGRIAHRKLYKRAVNDVLIKTERPHEGYRWGALDVITFPFAGICMFSLSSLLSHTHTHTHTQAHMYDS
jgi:hypothetical protein